jgi:hypothetical protein
VICRRLKRVSKRRPRDQHKKNQMIAISPYNEFSGA